ncbi:putative IQ motif, EF-hand binding, BAG domain, BAG domain superfamily [Helianthus annuus]|nr:putative IQ motif, EF-hand binding, BAG domain, BAG domain superfamily [Helianthus annuus]
MSEHEAALIIQSVYRGFEVRKSQPLKKLRQIYEVRKMVADLTNRIQDMETCLDSKKAVIIGETIMSLLLKLDTIQGLHPFVREVRKSVAKELVGLQEKLDYLTSVKSETPSEGSMHPEDDGKLDQAQAQTGLCENHEHNDDAEACKTTNVEQQLEKSTEGDSIQDRFDHAATECDEEAVGLCENHEVGATESQEGCNTIGEEPSHEGKFDQAPTECQEAPEFHKENHEVEPTESLLESQKERIDQAPTECVGLCVSHEVEATESQVGCNCNTPQLESDKDQEAPTESDEVEATVSQEGCNTSAELHNDQAPAGCDRLHKEDHEVEATSIGESHKEKSDQAPSECDGEDGGVECDDDMKVEDNTGEVNKKKKKKQVEREELVNVESMVEEENEKLRVVVEELMKAGNEQLEVIRELTGRVKELEKKLSNSKSKKLNKKSSRRSRGCNGIQKDYYSLVV